MTCQDCPRHDPETRRCLDGKINPHRWERAVDVVNLFGVRALCPFSDFRERLAKSRLRQCRVSTGSDNKIG